MYKRIFFLNLFTLILGWNFAQNNDSLQYTKYTYPDGTLSSEGYLQNGQPEGFWKSYHPNGTLASEGFRRNFQLDSIWIFYNDKGTKELEVHYSLGKKNGKRVQYFEKEIVEEQWLLDTLVNFTSVYYKDSQLKKRTPIVEGKPHGLEKQYNRDSLIIAVAQYYRGVLIKRETINRIDQFNYKQGPWKFFWPNGNLQLEGTYYNDKKHGFFKYYDENGQFLSVEKWENDQLIVDAPETKKLDMKTAYHPNGQPSITATYYKDVPEGIRRDYDTLGNITRGYIFQNGWLRYEGITDANGLRQGLWKEYYDTGELRSEGHYKNSIMTGTWNFYFTDKKVEITGKYNSKGQKTGSWIWYYPNRQELMVENWAKGELDGEYFEYDENGTVITSGTYYMGAEDGDWYYNNNGTIEKGAYYEGLRTGDWKMWYPNGNLMYEATYDQDLYDGKYTAYWDNGKVKLEGKYEIGTRIGSWVRYDEEGNPTMTTIYKEGREVQWNDYKITYE